MSLEQGRLTIESSYTYDMKSRRKVSSAEDAVQKVFMLLLAEYETHKFSSEGIS